MGKRIVKDLTPDIVWGPVIKRIDEEMGTVRAELSVTNNLGDFNSVKIGMIWEDPQAEGETVDEAWERVYRTVEKKVEEALEEYTKEG